MKAIQSLFLLVFLSACVQVTEVEEDPSQRTLAQPVSKMAYGPRVLPLDEPHRYKVQIPVHRDAQIINRSLKDDPSKVVTLPFKIQAGILADDQVQDGQTYVYDIGKYVEGEVEVVESFEVEVPQDLLVNQVEQISANEEWRHYSRIFIAKGGVIDLQGFNLVIHAEALISQGGVIRTYGSGAKAHVGRAGGHGGNIALNLATGKGVLHVELRGQHGADGRAGNDYSFLRPDDSQAKHPVGQKGVKGRNGEDGYPGGNSGSLQVKIQADHQLDILASFEPGRGGAGGVGAPGQQVSSTNGLRDAGDPGDRGAQGDQGQKGIVCLVDLKASRCWN